MGFLGWGIRQDRDLYWVAFAKANARQDRDLCRAAFAKANAHEINLVLTNFEK